MICAAVLEVSSGFVAPKEVHLKSPVTCNDARSTWTPKRITHPKTIQDKESPSWLVYTFLRHYITLLKDNHPWVAKKTDTFPVLAKAGTDIDSSKGHMLLEQYLGTQAVPLQGWPAVMVMMMVVFNCCEVLRRIGTGVLNYALVPSPNTFQALGRNLKLANDTLHSTLAVLLSNRN